LPLLRNNGKKPGRGVSHERQDDFWGGSRGIIKSRKRKERVGRDDGTG